MEDIHLRVAHLEKETHTMKYRVDAIESEKLPHRMTSVESAVREMAATGSRVENGLEELRRDVAKQKIWVALIVAGGTGGAELVRLVQGIMS